MKTYVHKISKRRCPFVFDRHATPKYTEAIAKVMKLDKSHNTLKGNYLPFHKIVQV